MEKKSGKEAGLLGISDSRENTSSLDDFQAWDRHDEMTARIAIGFPLAHDFVGEVPGEDQEIIGLLVFDLFGWHDRKVVSAHVQPMFARAEVGDPIQMIPVDATISEQRAGFCRGSIAADCFTCCFQFFEFAHQVALKLFDFNTI